MQKIAIVDDAADNRDFLYYLLRDEYVVFTYESGEDALNHIRQDSPDLIIMDIRLRGIDGIAVLERIRSDSRLPSVPIIALTANVMLGDREKYLAAGFDEYLPKPILDIEHFVATVRRLLSQREPK
jgi:CheY-like chemotaxis protein